MKIFIGWDPSEREAWGVADLSLRTHSHVDDLDVCPLRLNLLQEKGLYRRPTETRDRQLWDVLSQAPMSTEHAIARFFIPHLSGPDDDWVMFMDGDVLVRRDIAELFALRDPRFAVQVVQHRALFEPMTKKGGMDQTAYPRKNWSSVMLWNLAHRSNKRLTLDILNSWRGLALHQFAWLEDSEIGELPPEWNWLVGHSDPAIHPAIVHFTEGLPNIPGMERVAYADDWKLFTRSYEQMFEKMAK